ncbi:hypothetical protein HX776_19505 [Pseudomonas agarici]|uniref:hypothetical protein n=1 Tax=Pseudomonas agarici TaxID=46677 RepID=UPI0003725811|nr:hypothetical protein [Pseudomonas agarici]NWC10991.1 hypothetical protein [Pseudomonas agarici]SEL35401.1 hypothetical protein SAMN05216604_11632 [Pseudomonas agarici]
MRFEDLQGRYLLLWNVDSFEWPDNMLPYFEVFEGYSFKGNITCLFSEGATDKEISGRLYHDSVSERICISFDSLVADPECDVEGSFCEIYKAPSVEAMDRMQRATHYKIVATSAGEYNLLLKNSEAGSPVLRFTIADELREPSCGYKTE